MSFKLVLTKQMATYILNAAANLLPLVNGKVYKHGFGKIETR